MQCKYPKWAIHKIPQKQHHQLNETTNKRHIPSAQPTKKKCHIVVPYSQGICENFKTICQNYGVQVHFKEGTTLKNLLVSPKDKDTITKNSVIYLFKCDKIECEDEYIGGQSRTFGEGYKEHLKTPSPIFEHQNNTGHTTSVENFKIIGREGQNMARAIKEVIYIRVTNPALNRNIGKYNLPHFWIEFYTPS